MIPRRTNNIINNISTTRSSILLASLTPSLANICFCFTSKRTYFVQHKKTPNADCMMFVVPHHRFRIGSQVELERAIREANERKLKEKQQKEEEEDWDGPGALVGNKTSQETREEKDAKAKKLALEQFHIQRRKYFAQRDAEIAKMEAEGKSSSEKKNEQNGTTTEQDEIAACNIADEEDFFSRMESMPKSRSEGNNRVHRAASMPTNKNSSVKKEKESSKTETQNKNQLPSGFLDDSDESTYVNATYIFTKDTMHLSPLARRVFECEAGANVIEVVVGKDFITVRRKSEEDLLAEKALEASGEKQTEEERQNAENQIIATSFGTLSGMMGDNNKKSENKDEENENENENENEKEINSSSKSEKDETRDNLAKLYAESDAKKSSAAAAATNKSKSTTVPEMNVKTISEEDAKEFNEKQQQTGENSEQQPVVEGVTVADWFDLQFPVTAAITDHLHFSEVSVDLSAPHPYSDTEPQPEDTEVILSIKELIAEHLRPLLQSDGGDIRFIGFFPEEDSVIKVEMLGSCKTCKKSDTTLRDLIERTIRHFVPEVLGVKEINGKLAEK